MASLTFDISLGRETEFHERVNNNDPANAALILVVLASTGLEADSVLRTYATLSALLAATTNEVTNTNYGRKTLTDANISAPSVDTATHRTTLSFDTPTQVFATILAGDAWRKILVCYDSDTTAGTDANIVPVTAHDLLISGAAVVPNGNNINAAFSTGYCIAS